VFFSNRFSSLTTIGIIGKTGICVYPTKGKENKKNQRKNLKRLA
jgi:hypothetical protein